MSESAGFASRRCMCLWSDGEDPIAAIRDNHKTYLHTLWQKDHFYVDILHQEGKKELSVLRILWSAVAYPIGMLGYLADTIAKVVLLTGNLVIFIASVFSCQPEWRETRLVILADTGAALSIAIVGIVVPPLAYHLDQMAQESMQKWASK